MRSTATLDVGELLEPVKRAALEAAAAILEVYDGEHGVTQKRDLSPVTLADAAAERVILRHLAALAPEIPVVAEEQCEAHGLPETAPERFWLVDPLDGTKEFIKRNGEFTVNIALVVDGRAVLGVVGLPAKHVLYAGAGPGTAELYDLHGLATPISARPCPAEGATVAYSRSHADKDMLENFLASRRIADRIVAGSSLKFCLIAEGKADLYPRLGPTMEWDTAAGQAVLEAAGGRVEHLDGRPFRYGKPGFRNSEFLARGR